MVWNLRTRRPQQQQHQQHQQHQQQQQQLTTEQTATTTSFFNNNNNHMNSSSSEPNMSTTETTRLVGTETPTAVYSEGHVTEQTSNNGNNDMRQNENPENGTDNNDTNNDNDNNNNDNDNDNERMDDFEVLGEQITTLTNRLRILFYTLYIPVIPLSLTLIGMLANLLTKAAYSPSCSHPLRCFSLLSLLLFIYIPNHRRIKMCLFNYNRERDGIIRPRAVRVYDQCFHMMCIMYVYFDMTLIQNCKDDIATADIVESTCMTTCPELYRSFMRFDLILRIFSVILLLPLVCLPFVYLWIMRRINSAEAFARFERNLGGGGGSGQDDLLAGGVTVKHIMEGLREVILVESDESASDAKPGVRVVGVGKESWSGNRVRDRDTVKDCCICMCEFETLKSIPEDIINGTTTTTTTSNDYALVETKCGHLFHKGCIGGWIGGNNWEAATSRSNGRARRRNCPMCRKDLAIDESDIV